MGGENIEAEMEKKAPFPLMMTCAVYGHEYALGDDWRIRVGSFRRGNTTRGFVIEVSCVFGVDISFNVYIMPSFLTLGTGKPKIEYTPCNRLLEGAQIIDTFLPAVHARAMQPAWDSDRLRCCAADSCSYELGHTAMQWVDLLQML